jgi:hypothetical protein
MVEIFALYILCRNIGRILRRKGIHPTKHQLLAVFPWIAFEFLAAVLLAASGAALDASQYPVLLLAGIASIPVSFRIARLAEPPHRPATPAPAQPAPNP